MHRDDVVICNLHEGEARVLFACNAREYRSLCSEMKDSRYSSVLARIGSLIAGEQDEVAVMATVACELHHAFGHFHWTGFYRVVEPGWLKIGPYQGGHGCLAIAFGRGVCGTVAQSGKLIRLDDVDAFPGHIACSSITRSEIVVPVLDPAGAVRAVLDIDSDQAAAFDSEDERQLAAICALISRQVY
jgi:L-methionine (R)-S-oxide reductase